MKIKSYADSDLNLGLEDYVEVCVPTKNGGVVVLVPKYQVHNIKTRAKERMEAVLAERLERMGAAARRGLCRLFWALIVILVLYPLATATQPAVTTPKEGTLFVPPREPNTMPTVFVFDPKGKDERSVKLHEALLAELRMRNLRELRVLVASAESYCAVVVDYNFRIVCNATSGSGDIPSNCSTAFQTSDPEALVERIKDYKSGCIEKNLWPIRAA